MRRKVSRFRPLALQDDDVAITSREAPGAWRYNEPAYRPFQWRNFSNLVKLPALPRYENTQYGFKSFRAEAAESLFGAQRFDGMSFDVEVLYIAPRGGNRVGLEKSE
jgi:dolichyl-phosphate beta-glucosyltransferase